MTTEGIIVPFERISPETLQSMLEEFVTREWSEISDFGYSLEEKIGQVQKQLQDGTASVVFDVTTETCNIVQTDRLPKHIFESDDV